MSAFLMTKNPDGGIFMRQRAVFAGGHEAAASAANAYCRKQKSIWKKGRRRRVSKIAAGSACI